jgi:hypothetical protein
VYLKKAKPLDGLLRERPARHDLPGRNPVVQAQVYATAGIAHRRPPGTAWSPCRDRFAQAWRCHRDL